jgi:hypothetical protein
MAEESGLFFALAFVLVLNMLLVFYGLNSQDINLNFPSLPANPGFFNYLGIIWDWVAFIFSLFILPFATLFLTITGVGGVFIAAIMSVILAVVDLGGIYAAIRLIRG